MFFSVFEYIIHTMKFYSLARRRTSQSKFNIDNDNIVSKTAFREIAMTSQM